MFRAAKMALVGLAVLLLALGAVGPALADDNGLPSPNENACYGQWIAHMATFSEGLAHVPARDWNGNVGGVEGAQAFAEGKECPPWPPVPAD